MRIPSVKLLSLMSGAALFGAWLAAPEETLRQIGHSLDEAILPTSAGAQEASEPPTFSPVKALASQEAYFPGTEDLDPEEMRVIACGTGMPNARPKQAAACFLVELGNGDKFIFDIGTGSAERLSGLSIPYDYLDKVFIGHLHADHFGDLDALWVGGVIGNRQRPLRVWGPSGAEEKYGTAYAVNAMQEMMTWDTGSRQGNVNTLGLQIEMNEFDYKGVGLAVYEENDVVIKSYPAIHAIDGPVSYTLEWNDMMFAFSSDTAPNKWWIEATKGADFAIHESFSSPTTLIEKQKWPAGDALNVSTQVHTSPAQFGKVMAETQPRMAVAYHFFNDFDTAPVVERDIRTIYDGPLSLAVDYMVWNITKDDIRLRMAVINEDAWPLPSVTEKLPADPEERIGFSDFVISGAEKFPEVLRQIYADINEHYGSDFKPEDHHGPID